MICFRYRQLTFARFCASQSLRNSSSLKTALSFYAKSTILAAKFTLHRLSCSITNKDSLSS